MPTFVMLPPQQSVAQEWTRRLAADVPELTVLAPAGEPEAVAALATADAAFGTLTTELLSVADRLRWLQAPAAAPPAGFYFAELIAHPVQVTNFRGIFNDHVGTHATALMLGLARGFGRYMPRQARHEWRPEGSLDSIIHLPEATALIIGVGGIGQAVAAHCQAFGMRVVGVDPRTSGTPGLEVYGVDRLDELLPEADVVILTIPHTPVTEGLMNARRFAAMKPTAVLVNVGRGKTVVLDDLVRALRDGEIAGAGLDVYDVEPLPADHPLWDAPNVLLTPHVGVTGPYLDERRYQVLADNARRFVAGEPLRNVVDKAVWH